MNDTIPWSWQDTATIIGCISILVLAFWIRHRLQKGGASSGGGCSGCGSNEDSGAPAKPAPPVLIQMKSLSIGQHKKR